MQQRIGTYQVLEEIASGGQATVYRVWDTHSGRVVALKVLHPHLARDTAYLERFHREAQLAASLDHPNVVRIFEVGQEEETHFIALEYLPLSLHHLIRAQDHLPLDRAVDIAHQIALGLEAAHQQGITHRDIKPQNILLGPEGTVKVTDFGIARAGDLSTMTRTGAVMGTPHYMSPEQAKGLRADSRSDLYSLGVALYQMLTGALPFDADTPWEVIRRHIEAPPPPVRQARPEVSPALEAVGGPVAGEGALPPLSESSGAGPGPGAGGASGLRPPGRCHSPSTTGTSASATTRAGTTPGPGTTATARGATLTTPGCRATACASRAAPAPGSPAASPGTTGCRPGGAAARLPLGRSHLPLSGRPGDSCPGHLQLWRHPGDLRFV